MNAYVIALQPVQPEPDDQVRERGEHGLPVLGYVRLVEHLAHRHEPEVGRVLRVLGDGQPVGDEQLREVHLDHGVAAAAVRLDHPFALDGHRERAREQRRGDDALGFHQRPAVGRAAPVHLAATVATVAGIVFVAGRQRGNERYGGDRDTQHGGAESALPRPPQLNATARRTSARRLGIATVTVWPLFAAGGRRHRCITAGRHHQTRDGIVAAVSVTTV